MSQDGQTTSGPDFMPKDRQRKDKGSESEMNAVRHRSTTDWLAAGATVLAALVVYVLTLAPTVTLEYSGMFVVAAEHLGVARTPGYPIWHILAHGFTVLFSFVRYHGYPNPAWAVNFMSAVFGALACGALALLVARETRRLFPAASIPGDRYARILCFASACSAGLLFGFTQAMWSQSVITDTHSLTNFCLLAFLNVLLCWMETKKTQTAYAVAFLLGLSPAISPLLLLLAPVALLAAAFVSRRMLVCFAAATAGFLGFLMVEFFVGRESPWLGFSVLDLTLVLVLTLLLAPRTRMIGILLALMLAGLLSFVYLPLAAGHNPPMNAGYACTWQGFWHVINRGQFERMNPVNPFTQTQLFLQQLEWYVRMTTAQFTGPILSIALVPIVCLPFLRPSARRTLLVVLGSLFLFSIVTLIGMNLELDRQTTFIARAIFIPSFALLAILIGYGLVILLDGLGERRAWKNERASGPRASEQRAAN